MADTQVHTHAHTAEAFRWPCPGPDCARSPSWSLRSSSTRWNYHYSHAADKETEAEGEERSKSPTASQLTDSRAETPARAEPRPWALALTPQTSLWVHRKRGDSQGSKRNSESDLRSAAAWVTGAGTGTSSWDGACELQEHHPRPGVSEWLYLTDTWVTCLPVR